MAEKKKTKEISNRQLASVGGVFLCLLACVLALNVGYVARALAYPFVFLLGVGSNIFYAFLCVGAILLTFRGYFIKGKSALKTISLIILFLLLLALFSDIYSRLNKVDVSLKNLNEYYFSIYKNINADHGSYFKSKFLDIYYSYPFAGGYIGYGLYASLVSLVNEAFALSIIIIGIVLCIFFFFLKEINILFQKFIHRERKTKPHEEEEVEEKPIPLMEATSVKDLISSASQLPDDYSNDFANGVKPTPRGFNDGSNSSFLESSSFSGFVKAHFASTDENGFTSEVSTFTSSTFINPTREEKPQEETPRINEQMTLDFDQEKPTEQVQIPKPVPVTKPKPVVAPRPKLVKWVPPSSQLLTVHQTSEAIEENTRLAEERKDTINKCFETYGVGALCNSFVIGPSVTRFNIEYLKSESVKSVRGLISDLSIKLNGVTARFEEIVPGQQFSGIEIPNARITTVSFKEVFEHLPDVKKHPLAIPFGKNISGEIISLDFNDFPHLLVSGTTGSGKSVYLHSIIATLIMRCPPEVLRIILVDPKKVEFKQYEGIPHLLCPLISSADEAKLMLEKMIDVMNDRFDLFGEADGVVKIDEYNQWATQNGKEKLPYIIIILDEYNNLLENCKGFSMPVISLAQKARACGIHLLISTQRPSTDVISGVLKANLPTRVALMTANYTDSISIIGEGGAEKLLGKGDMLVQSPLLSRVGLTRFQSAFISSAEISHVTNYLRSHYESRYEESLMDLVTKAEASASSAIGNVSFTDNYDANEDKKYEAIKQWVMSQEYCSMSKIQRECQVGFNRAGRFFQRLVKEGIVSPTPESASKGNKVLVNDRFYGSETNDDNNIPDLSEDSDID